MLFNKLNFHFPVIANQGMQYETPAYENEGGTGNRTGLITVTPSAGLGTSGATIIAYKQLLVNGNPADGLAFCDSVPVAGETIKFLFGTKVIINEAKYYQGLTPAGTMGSWKWQLDVNDDGTWVDVGTAFTMGGGATQTQIQLSANVTPAKAYRLLGVSGNANTGGFIFVEEFEFKIGNPL